jgi:hypothetical protein
LQLALNEKLELKCTKSNTDTEEPKRDLLDRNETELLQTKQSKTEAFAANTILELPHPAIENPDPVRIKLRMERELDIVLQDKTDILELANNEDRNDIVLPNIADLKIDVL